MPYLELPGARLYYEVHGRAAAADARRPAIVFAHGAGGNHLSWWQQVPAFRDRFTCVVFDHRRWGLSTEEPGGPGGAAFAGDLHALLDALEIERTTLVAQSMGGWTCLRFALAWPGRVDRLLLADTHGGISSPDVDGWGRASVESVAKLPPGVHPAIGERMYREQPELAFLYEEIDALNPVTRAEIVTAIQQAGVVPAEEAARLRVPVMLLYGEEDATIPPPFLVAAAALLPDAHVVPVPRAGHSVYFERAAAFNAALEDFLAR